jgi:DNA-binding MarR family transcriptional regulator
MDILRQSSNTRERLSLLSLMEALKDGGQITQRELALTTGLNLKKVNFCLHKLLEKGYVKFQRARHNTDKRAYLYILTPSGLKAKSQLTYQFLNFTLDFYSQMEDKLRRCLMQMSKTGVERVMLFGANDVARILLGLTDCMGTTIVGVLDNEYEGEAFHNVPVFKNESLHKVMWGGLLITSIEDIEEVEAQLARLGISEKTIWTL